MDSTMIDAHLENIDRRLTKLEQILPTLATKEELKALATKEELKALATKEEIRIAVAPLASKDDLKAFATRDEVQALLHAEHERLRLDMRILIEHQDSKLDLLAEHILSVTPKRTEE
jgi:TusA-related sulfurtransferase